MGYCTNHLCQWRVSRSGELIRPVTLSTVLLPQKLTQSVVLSSQAQQWNGLEVTQFKYSYDRFSIPPQNYHAIWLHLGERLCLSAKIGGSEYAGCPNLGHVMIVPAFTESYWQLQTPQRSNVLLLQLEVNFVEDISNTVASSAADRSTTTPVELMSVFAQPDPQIRYIGLTLKAELESGCLSGRRFAESLATALALHVIHHYSADQVSDRPLSPSSVLQQVVDYIDEHILENLNLAELAQLSGLSQSYFVRQFKKSTGMTPYQYVLNCRVERAKHLLKQQQLTIAEVALRSGFKDQNHLTKIFRRFTGVTPKAFQNTL